MPSLSCKCRLADIVRDYFLKLIVYLGYVWLYPYA